MVEFKWEIDDFEVIPSRKGFDEIVRAIHWRYVATDGTRVAESRGIAVLPFPVDRRAYTALEDVTLEWTVAQLEALVDEDALKEALSKQVQDLGVVERRQPHFMKKAAAHPIKPPGMEHLPIMTLEQLRALRGEKAQLEEEPREK